MYTVLLPLFMIRNRLDSNIELMYVVQLFYLKLITNKIYPRNNQITISLLKK